MPSKTDTIPLKDPFLQRNCKLLPCQKEMVVWWRNEGLSLRKIASMFHVSKRLIQFITDPQKHIENLRRRDERGGSAQYYDKGKQAVAIRKHRQYKKKILPKQ